jgi:hypothetical protein
LSFTKGQKSSVSHIFLVFFPIANPLNLQLANDVVVFLLHGICTASVVSTLKLQKPVLSPTSKVDKYSEENNKEQRWSKKKSLLYLLFAVA